MSFDVVRNTLMVPAGVRGNLRDREPPMRSLLAWNAPVGDEHDDDSDPGNEDGGQLHHRRPLLGAAIPDRWETEAQQQFRFVWFLGASVWVCVHARTFALR
jgi:hypothetical protein